MNILESLTQCYPVYQLIGMDLPDSGILVYLLTNPKKRLKVFKISLCADIGLEMGELSSAAKSGRDLAQNIL